MKLPSTLTRSEVSTISKALRAEGRKLPRVGWCVKLPGGHAGEICRDAHGYYLTQHYPGTSTPLAKGNVYV